MSSMLIGFIIGLVIGCFVGVCIVGLFAVNKNDDDIPNAKIIKK